MLTLLTILSVALAAATAALLGRYLVAILAALRRTGGHDQSHLARLATALEGTVEQNASLPTQLEALERRLTDLRAALAAVERDLDAAAQLLRGDGAAARAD